MRVLIAYDGSPGSDEAVALAAALNWPAGSELRLVAVVEPAWTHVGPPPGIVPAPEVDAAIAGMHEERVASASRALAAAERETTGVVLYGRPATVLVDEAASFAADLVVAGSRGQGRIARLLLGSVSAELVDNAPCPVLVARTDRLNSVVLAVDGSVAATEAESLVSTWQIFQDLPIHVLSVTDMMEPVQFGLAPARYHSAAAEHAARFQEAQETHTRIANETADRLRAAGRAAEPTMRIGAAADEILDLASETGATLIVVGSQGRTGFDRMVLGSVARNVLHGGLASVLIVRERRAS